MNWSAGRHRGTKGRRNVQLADLLGLLPLDHVGDGLASDVTRESLSVRESIRRAERSSSGIQKGFNVEVVGSEDDLEEHLLVNLDDYIGKAGSAVVPSQRRGWQPAKPILAARATQTPPSATIEDLDLHFWSQSLISVVFLRVSSESVSNGSGSFL